MTYFCKKSKCVVFSFFYFTLDDLYIGKMLLIKLLIRRVIIAYNHYTTQVVDAGKEKVNGTNNK